MTESNTLKRILIGLAKHKALRLFRNNTGKAWQGKLSPAGPGNILLRDFRPLEAGLCKGSSDLIGWYTVEHGGKKIAVFTALEVKKEKGKVSPEQKNFIDRVIEAGGIAGVVKEQSDFLELLQTLGF